LNKKTKIINQLINVQGYVNAGCIVKKQDYILVVKLRKTGKWDIPAGKSLPGELPSKTAERETWEEAGVQVKVIRLLDFIDAPAGHGLYIYEAVPSNNQLALDVPLEINPQFAQEIVEARFLPIQDLHQDSFRYPEILPRVIHLFNVI